MFRKEWRQQLLVLSLLIVAVAAAVTGAAMTVNGATNGQAEFGDATALMRVDAKDPTRVQRSLDQARGRFGDVEVIGHQVVPIPGSVEVLDLRAQATDGTFSGPLLALRKGRYPTNAGEIALTKNVMALMGVHLGSTVNLGRVERIVVGEVENPSALGDGFGLLAPSEVTHAESLTVLANGQLSKNVPRPRSSTASAERTDDGPGLLVQGRADDDTAVATTVLIMTTVGMALVALIAAAGFVVVAQRRQRQLGLLGALGATERHLRLVMIGNGFIVGVIAALVGGALGVLGWMVSAPALETGIGHRLGRLDLPWTLIAICLLLAVAASTAAAWWPARTMARLPIMSALSRRPLRPSPVHRSLVVAVALVGIGMWFIRQAKPNGDDRVTPWMLMLGLLLVIVGMVLVAPGAVRSLARPAKRMPFAARLALRDLVRYQARAAASLAAITLGLGIAVTVVVLAQANEYPADEGNLSDRQIIVRPSDGVSIVGTLDPAAKEIGALIPGATLVPLAVAFNPDALANSDQVEPISAVQKINHGFRGLGATYVATPEVLASLGIDSADVKPDTELITSMHRSLTLLDISVRDAKEGAPVPTQVMDIGKYESAPRFLITQHAMQSHGWVAERDVWLVQSPKPLTSEQIAGARKQAAATGFEIEVRSSQDELATLRNGATVVGAVLALAIVAMTIGLLRGESVRDMRTLTATGAPSQTRRAVTASTATALAFLGVLVSIAGSYAALVASYSNELTKLSSPPIANLLALAIGLPLIAAAGGWLLGGREPATVSRQALD